MGTLLIHFLETDEPVDGELLLVAANATFATRHPESDFTYRLTSTRTIDNAVARYGATMIFVNVAKPLRALPHENAEQVPLAAAIAEYLQPHRYNEDCPRLVLVVALDDTGAVATHAVRVGERGR